MTITQQISIDLQQPGSAPVVHAVQGEEYTREVKVTLYSGGVAWTPPSGCEVAIRYGKPDGKGGIYDKLPDNATAWSILNNTISIILAPQMLTVAGIVNAQVEIIVNEKEILSTFHFIVDVEEDASMGAVKSENYTNWKSFWFPQTTGAKAGQYVKVTRVDSDGHVLAVSPTNEPNETNQLATNAKNTAESANSKAEQATTLANKAQSTANSALEKANAALPGDSLPDVINDALAQAKESGEFDGEDGKNGSNGLSILAVNITAGNAEKIEVYPENVIENEGALFPRSILVGDKVLTEDGKIFIVTSYGTKFDATTGANTTYYGAKFLINAGGSVKSVNGITPDENGNVEIKIPESSGGSVTIDTTLTQSGQAADAKAVGDALAELEKKIPEQPADAELFNKADLPLDNQSFITEDGVEYYRYNANATNFVWENPRPEKGAVTITARGVSQYGGSGSTRLKTVYDDGTNGPDLFIVVSGESKTTTVTTDENKTLARITGNYDLENWVLLDMSVMSVKAEYLVQEEYILPAATAENLGGIKADPVESMDTQPVRIGADGKLYTALCGDGGSKSPVVLGELTLAEDITGYGTIVVPLKDNPFNYSQLLITISAKQIDAGQFMGFLFGGGKQAQATHLNTVFSTTETTTVAARVTLFAESLFTLATKKGYQWLSTAQYSSIYQIDTDASATENMLKVTNSSAVAGATFKVEGIPK